MKIFSLSNFKINLNPKKNQEENRSLPPNFSMPIKDNFQKSPKSAEKLGFSGAITSESRFKLPVKIIEKMFKKYASQIANEPDYKKKSEIYDRLMAFYRFIRLNLDNNALIQKDFSIGQVREFIGDLSHEALNGFYVIKLPLSAANSKIKHRPLPENFQQICEKELNNIVDIYKKYQYFIDNKIYSPDFPLSKLLSHSLALVEGKAEKISVEGAELLENTKLDFQKTEIYSIFSNVIQNAAKYSNNKGDIKIKFEKGKCPKGREVLNFSVEDNGIGIPQNQLESVIKGQRASNTGEIQGTGYGLKRVNKILNHKFSNILIESEEGKGTKITCPLPILSSPER